MATWNSAFEAAPAGSDVPSSGDDKIRELKGAVRERLDKEHMMDLTSGLVSEDGWHEEGSAKAFIQASAPTTRPDGTTALSSADNGRIWIGSANDTVYVYDHSAGANNADRWVERGVINGNSLKGYESVTLTGYDTASAPSVASGSVVEVNGTYYALSGGAAMNGTAASGLNYIKFTASGDTVYPYWTQSASTWSDSKQGWYDGNDRYLFSVYYDGSSAYSNKVKLVPEQSPFDFLKPSFISRYTEDLTLSSNTTQRVIYARNLTIDTSLTLKARTIICEGDFTIDGGVTVTVSGLKYNTLVNKGATSGQNNPGARSDESHGGGEGRGGFGGQHAPNANYRGGGGGGFGEGGLGDHNGSDNQGGDSNEVADIADGGGNGTGGSYGGGACGAGGGAYDNKTNSNYGGELLWIIVKGNFVNNGTINNNGGDGSDNASGGGGGLLCVVAFGDTYTGGTINCEGGDGAGGSNTFGGGGGAIVVYAKTASFGTLSVAGGSGSVASGGTGVTETVDIRDNPSQILGGEASDTEALGAVLSHWIEGFI